MNVSKINLRKHMGKRNESEEYRDMESGGAQSIQDVIARVN